MPADAPVGFHIEPAQETHGDAGAARRRFWVPGGITVLHMRDTPQPFVHGLVDGLDAEQAFMTAVALCQLFQQIQHEVDLFPALGPLAHAADAAVVKAVLAAGDGMQVDQDLKAVPFRPGKGLVQLFDAADIGFHVSENKIGDRNADGVQPHGADANKVTFRNVFRAMHLYASFIDLFGKLTGQIVFIPRVGIVKQRWTHPFLQHKPVSQIDAFDLQSITFLPMCAACKTLQRSKMQRVVNFFPLS